MSNICPNCSYGLVVELESRSDDLFAFSVKGSRISTNLLSSALLNYWRWVAEGKPPRYDSYAKPPIGQLYYDDYHNHMEYRGGRYHFSIQTLDSPEGDIWWTGSFILDSRMTITDVRVT